MIDSRSIEKKSTDIISVAVPVPLRKSFDFLLPVELLPATMGARIKVPFGSRKLVGIIVDIKDQSDFPRDKLKSALQTLDNSALFDAPLWATLQWLSRYYLAPIGEVVEAAMPVLIRQGAPLTPPRKKSWCLTDYGCSSPINELNRAPLQRAIIQRFMHKIMRNGFLDANDLKQESVGWRQAINSLVKKGWLEEHEAEPTLTQSNIDLSDRVTLNQEQSAAADVLEQLIDSDSFSCSLLHGVTGSGKTQVYFSVMQRVLDMGQQILLMVPEIGLTPQLVERVECQFSCPVVVMHSGLNDTERHLAWWHARQGNAHIVIGTRSAVFSCFANLGLIIVDEEHDASFKQQEGVRYQARDVAIYRAKQHNIPIILGSATPSLESYSNAKRGRYQFIKLTKRATKVTLPQVELFDLNCQPGSDGLSPAMLQAIAHTLNHNKQVMLFLNRRGYAPVLYCKDCGETTQCHRCDSHLTLHQRANRMRCHHCGYEEVALKQCGHCKSGTLVEVGEGTQRVEEALALRFPSARLLRIDRDNTRRKGELQKRLLQAREGGADILLGTQLITKGHDFPNLAMVGILNADQGIYSTDFRASEALFQQTLQVSGRAGRRDEVGRVYIQTHFPNHPFFARVRQHDFDGFAEALMQERQLAHYPPYGFFALLRSESVHQDRALQFLRHAKRDIVPGDRVRVMDAIPAPMERRAGKYRAQLLICADQRSQLNTTLVQWLNYLEVDKTAKKRASSVRWSLDIDPLDHY